MAYTSWGGDTSVPLSFIRKEQIASPFRINPPRLTPSKRRITGSRQIKFKGHGELEINEVALRDEKLTRIGLLTKWVAPGQRLQPIVSSIFVAVRGTRKSWPLTFPGASV